MTRIGDGAFSGCSKLESVVIPEGTSSISPNVFMNCTSLKSVDIRGNIRSIGLSAFNSCSNLSSINIPSSVTAIYESAFFRCSSLKSIIIPENVTFIGNNAFIGCSNLTSVSFFGTSDPCQSSSDVFSLCDSFNLTCVSDNYESASFCGRSITCKSSSCETITEQHNQCYEVVSNGTECVVRKRIKATEWENRTNGCWEYHCDNESGLIPPQIKCTSEGNSHMLCIDDTECIEENDIPIKEWMVEIFFNHSGSPLITSNQIVTELNELSGISPSDVSVSVEYDEDGKITRVVVFVNEETTAYTMESSLSSECKSGVERFVCGYDGVHIREMTPFLSLSEAVSKWFEASLLMTAACVFFLVE